MAQSNGVGETNLARGTPPGASGPSGASRMADPPGILRNPEARNWNTDIPNYLPHEKVFPIQIGTELFRLSGASLSSDENFKLSAPAKKPRAPSYFSQYFQCQLRQAEEKGEDPNTAIRTLYIDRDPITFRDISLHLQGYHVAPRDASHFVKLFADAQFYSLPRLISQLYEENIFITVGDREFQIPRELFSDPGNSPNYFSLSFTIFFSSPTEVFPGLSREGLLRPPSILPPSVPNRSSKTFSEILHLLRGYPLEIRSPEHRAELLRDCRYFHLKGLEQKLIPHSISYNLLRKKSEITIRLADIRQSGLSILTNISPSTAPSPEPLTSPNPPPTSSVGYVHYQRPFADSSPSDLILEIGDSATLLHWDTMRLEFFGETKIRMGRLLEVVATKLNLPVKQPLGLLMKNGGASSEPASPGKSGLSEEMVRVVVGEDCGVVCDGKVVDLNGATDENSSIGGQGSSKKRRIGDGIALAANIDVGPGLIKDKSWIVKSGQWRLRVQNHGGGVQGARMGVGMGGQALVNGKAEWECVLVAVRLDAVSGERGRNLSRGFLGE
ncbi:putative btb poz domain-containing protein [Botrytis fragariae]|uniref:Putative btb poz domain-containing protein n=1 Tax=Botrytis fragariae TaxID=1964551 RepID=A0A8H6EP87_9HELO|nr:putative btb poz domain-containing protein [Botrytis fragariae]KAF5879483.1 putative btb poz domain-containing protein [Botrytis fragariae]